ncbi:nuclear transport factor 2 family protein [Belliella sp. R4-6]|uniref:Nuclear transport factor 2 family protein n=1 Tax=Belliella alkalica TaxID=1730871 RepID=A0ABS9VCL3_9BACT|nr:nuclear transport factor 2 family protein [Belliella alkalica]MCH7414181.1 nuclear transport factor 2 family protein [Belliella alkalica]
MDKREKIISSYIQAYNSFDVPKMTANFSDKIIFTNIQNGETSMTLNGIEEFKKQAELAKTYFSERQQIVKAIKHKGEKSQIEIEYYGVLAIDFPNGMKKGQEIRLNGTSIFEFSEDEIIKLTDIS